MSKGKKSIINYLLFYGIDRKTMKTPMQWLKGFFVIYWKFLQYIGFYPYSECPQDTA